MNKKKGMVLFVFFVFLVGIVSNVRGKAENENDSDAVKSIENQENNSQETESLDNDLSQKDILEVVLEKEILPVKEEKDEPAELVCCDEGKDIYLQRQTDNLKQTGFAEESTDDSVAFSLSGKKAELVPVEGWSFPALNITLENGTKIECELTDVFFSAILDFYWIDEERVILEGHVNPSLNVCIVYNLKENSFDEYYGVFFTWNDDYSKLYFVETSPHFGSEPAPEKIIDQEGTIYYETNKGEYLINHLVLDATNEYMGFYVKTIEEGKNFGILNCETMAVLYEEKDIHYNDVEILVK